METTELPPGIYRISAVGYVDGVDDDSANSGREFLTDGDQYVTVCPPSAHPDPKQEWLVEDGKDGNTIIGRPTNRWPSPYLTYDGAPGRKPEPGDQIKIHVFDFPWTEWHLKYVPGPYPTHLICVAGSDLGISLSPITIFPPMLVLNHEKKFIWKFEFVRPK